MRNKQENHGGPSQRINIEETPNLGDPTNHIQFRARSQTVIRCAAGSIARQMTDSAKSFRNSRILLISGSVNPEKTVWYRVRWNRDLRGNKEYRAHPDDGRRIDRPHHRGFIAPGGYTFRPGYAVRQNRTSFDILTGAVMPNRPIKRKRRGPHHKD